MRVVALWRLLIAIACSAANPCEDSLDWSAGKNIPYDHATLQRSISHVGNIERLRPLLRKLGGGSETARILIVGGPFTHGGSLSSERVCSDCWGHLWQDVFIDWLKKTFLVDVDDRELHISGAISHHLQTIPETAKAFLPDLILVETSLSPLMQPGQSPPSEQTGRYLIDETFMRSLLQLPNIPAVVWVELMAAPPYVTNEMTDSLLTEYYNVPQVSIKTAWKNRMPFESSAIWAENPLKMTALGHKLVAVTLANFMCFELKHTCNSSGVASKVLPKPLFSPQLEDNEEQAIDAGESMVNHHDLQNLDFCGNKDIQSLPIEATAATGTSPQTAWSAFAVVALIPVLLISLCAFFVTAGPQYYLENNLPVQLPELEFLRIVATVNLVAFQFYQEFPAPWAYNGENEHGPCTWCRSGKYCFQFFFLHSGFVLTLSTIRNGASSAIWLYAQVWPLHAFGLVLSLVSGAEINPLSIELCACLVHSWGPPFHSDLNGPSWYLSTLLAFWIMIPLWVRAADRVAAIRGIPGISLFIVCVWLSTLLFPIFVFFHPLKLGLHEQDPQLALSNVQAFRNFIEYSPYCNWAPMVMGILLACLVMLGIEPRSSLSAGICLMVALVGLSIAWYFVPAPGANMDAEHLLLEKGFGLFPMFAMLILGAVGARNFSNPIHRLVTGRWMALPAKLCWPMFLLHEPVHKLCLKYLFPYLYSNPNAYWLNSCLYPVAVFLISLLVSALIDTPWARLLYRCRRSNGENPDRDEYQGNPNKNASYERLQGQGYRTNRNMSMTYRR
mmetsp:Transcript_112728/g.218455  ORF Transcript_112728/g.218455 Transcript_112728/m.218455 type:complete len:785 (+) Transcript_112728:18-2372(+)